MRESRPQDAVVAQRIAKELQATGGHRTLNVLELLSSFEVQRLTASARERLDGALLSAGVSSEPTMLIVKRTDVVTLRVPLSDETPLPKIEPEPGRPSSDIELLDSQSVLVVLDVAAAGFGALVSRLVFDLEWILALCVGSALGVGWHLWWTAEDRVNKRGGFGAGLLSAAIILLLGTGITGQLDEREQREVRRQAAAAKRQASEQQRRDLQLQLSTRQSLVGFNLRGQDLRGFDLSGRNLSRATLDNADLRETYFFRSKFRKAQLDGANLSGAIFSEVDAREASFVDATLNHTEVIGAKFDGAHLIGADLQAIEYRDTSFAGAVLYEAKMAGVALPGVNLAHAELGGADLTGANLERADLTEIRSSVRVTSGEGALRSTTVRGTNFRSAELSGVNLRRADLSGADFRRATLRGADLRFAFAQRYGDPLLDQAIGRDGRHRTDFRGADLRGADMRGAFLAGADLRGASLRGARFVAARYDDTTRWPEGFDPHKEGALLVKDRSYQNLVLVPKISTAIEFVEHPNGKTISYDTRLERRDVELVPPPRP